MSPSVMYRRPVRVGGASGAFSDRRFSISRMAKNASCDVIVGDWMAEKTMAELGVAKASRGKVDLQERLKNPLFAITFIDCFEPAIEDLKKNGIKLAVNAGSCDSATLAHLVEQMCKDKGCPMNVAWIEGDDVIDKVKALVASGTSFLSLNRGNEIDLKDWKFEPLAAQAYLGGLGITEAFRKGADIVICGRVADAAPTIGAAAWWHDWSPTQFEELAGALVAGHLIECASYITGGNYSGFKELLKTKKHLNMGFPIAEVDHLGECVITKEQNTGGIVNVETVTSQLVYEIQGPLYYNADVTADIENIQMEQIGKDRVAVSGVKGLPPPPTTKVGISALGGYQAEYHVYFVGLDMEEKARWTEDHVREAIGDRIKKFSLLKFHVNGTSPVDAPNQDLATVDMRIFAQSPDRETLNMKDPDSFGRLVMSLILESAPGASLSNDLRQIEPKPFEEYYVTLFSQSEIQQRVHLLFNDRHVLDIATPSVTQVYPRQQRSYDTANPVDLSSFGETVRAPLGYIVLGRSGDKASDCNAGLFVRNDDEWVWLRSFLSTDKIKELLGAEYKSKPIDRFELAHLRCVHFLLHDHLDRGYCASSTYDTLGKNCIEYLRARTVDLPKKFLERGRV